MAANLKILVPEATTNYIKNPSFRYTNAATDWIAVGSVITRVLTQALYGIASLQVITNGLATKEGVSYRVSDLIGISNPITASVYVRGAGCVHLRLIEGLGKQWVSKAITLRSDRWQRLEVSGYSTGSNDMSMYIETDGDAKSITFYITAAQMELKAYATTYCDGDQPGCWWNIMDHQSISSRSPSTRQGGHWIDLAGPCRENDNIYVTTLGGMGMASLQNNTQSWALTHGSFYQNTKILDRVITFAFTVKNKNLRASGKPDLSNLHRLRQQLIDIFKPDVTSANEPFLLSYQEGEREIFIPVRYEAGLEGDWDIRNSWVNTFPIRFIAVDPIFFENNLNAQSLTFTDGSLLNYIACRVQGKWDRMTGGLDSAVYSLAKGKSGQIYAGGQFINNTLGTVVLNRITYWDGTKFNSISSGANDVIYAVAVAPNGDVYAGGMFTSIGGVAANRIAKWNGTIWSALGTGLDGMCEAIAISAKGYVYVSGPFTDAGGTGAKTFAWWDGATWHKTTATMGIFDASGIAITKDGTMVYYCTSNNPSGGNVYQFNVATELISKVGGDFSGFVIKVALSPSGVLYSCGTYVSCAGTTLNNISKWNGSAWVALGDGFNNTVQQIAVSSKEQIIACGSFTKTGTMNMPGTAFWNGSNWTNLDIYIGYIYSIIFKGDDIYASVSNSNITKYAAINNVFNYGTAKTYPIIYIFGPGILRWIENQTTKKTMYMNLTIFDDEEIFIDFGKKQIYSSTRGDLTYSIIPGSDFDDFYLVPGNNVLSVFMTDDVDSKMMIYHRPQHWSADATVNAEALT